MTEPPLYFTGALGPLTSSMHTDEDLTKKQKQKNLSNMASSSVKHVALIFSAVLVQFGICFFSYFSLA